MNLSSHETKLLLSVIESLTSDDDPPDRRFSAGRGLIELLRADYFASYEWNEGWRCFENGTSINMSDDNLKRYEEYFQFRDPITKPMQRVRRAINVHEVMDRSALSRTEFFNDFLAVDGLHFGVNLHVYDGATPLADWRIWRSRRRTDFDRRDLEILDLLAPHLRNVTRFVRWIAGVEASKGLEVTIGRIQALGGLSARQSQIAYHAFLGNTDAQIADKLFISVATTRSHLRNVYRRLGVKNRVSLCHRLSKPHDFDRRVGKIDSARAKVALTGLLPT